MDGVIYVAYGEAARRECRYSVESLRGHMDVPVSVVCDRPIDGVNSIQWDDPRKGARWAKLNLDTLTPYEYTLYLDADTRVHADLGNVFGILRDGWDMAIAPSTQQGASLLWHVGDAERRATLDGLGNAEALGLQAGVFGFRRGLGAFWGAWREEWLRYNDQDQAALLRALAREPVRLWLLGRPWNGGALVEHRFGCARA